MASWVLPLTWIRTLIQAKMHIKELVTWSILTRYPLLYFSLSAWTKRNMYRHRSSRHRTWDSSTRDCWSRFIHPSLVLKRHFLSAFEKNPVPHWGWRWHNWISYLIHQPSVHQTCYATTNCLKTWCSSNTTTCNYIWPHKQKMLSTSTYLFW